MSNIRKNVSIIAKALHRAGADSISVVYSGSGDSGSIDDVTVDWRAGTQNLVTSEDEALGDVALIVKRSQYVDSKWEHVETTEEFSVTDAAREVWEQAIDAAGLSGFGNNDGGSGSMTISADGQCNLSHTYNEQVADHKVTTFTQESPLWTNCQRIATVLREIGATEVEVSYEGYGDSGEINDAIVYEVEGPYPDVLVMEDPHDPDSDTVEMSLPNAALDMAEAAIAEAGHTGYETDDGGSGTFIITADGVVTLDHAEYYNDTSSGSSHNFDADGEDE